MCDAWKLVFEKTSACDSTGTASASSSDRRYPFAGSNFSETAPLRSRRLSAAAGSVASVVEYRIAA